MLKAIVAFKKAIADIDLKKAIAELKFGNFLIFRFFYNYSRCYFRFKITFVIYYK